MIKSLTLDEQLKRSQSTERIDFTKYQSVDIQEPLVKIESSGNILVKPYWTIEDDWEGSRYADYITDHPNYDGIYLRSEVAKRLQRAAENLDNRYRLVIRAGHRPIEVQKRILIDCAEDYQKEHPEVSQKEALEHARTFVNDPDITLPPHVCAAAVDVEVVEAETGRLLDFGSKMNDDTEQSFLYYPQLTVEQKTNRQLLLKAMLSAGFASCKPEWWHFSYGDQVWAWFYGKESSLYSPIDI